MAGDPLKQPRQEVAAAAKALADMREAKSLDEFEMEWRTCLNHLEKAWQKTERCCQPVRAQFEPWQGQFRKLRKKDMLLRYLKQARDADNHSVQDVTKLQPGSRGYKFLNSRGGYIKNMEIRNGEVVHYEGDPMIVEDTPPHPIAVPVKNHGEWFNPPTSHLGQAIPAPHPSLLAELGIKFYSEYVEQVWEKFFGFDH
ncbi:hypothetical protein LPB72_21550 [Hydrogenophaga crassostreae]|uniref:Uncharacterized protein n=1 Tax=Hydrogenophaga crassostreae TaxID=1763535 RepID=A0A167GK57_9BURK|nr:hypothetical protein [Hydrogenophaga crassostreae]AOW15109.1 hypothetical protein LPB072_22165 [Hydrogenophaga crassostreae]OAD39563.1 hypothetical protein LPB72_21550 [Hydrogenophaga crassostreae]